MGASAEALTTASTPIWGDCTVTWQYNPERQDAKAEKDLVEAIGKLELATGLTFVRQPDTTFLPTRGNLTDSNADITIAWGFAIDQEHVPGEVDGKPHDGELVAGRTDVLGTTIGSSTQKHLGMALWRSEQTALGQLRFNHASIALSATFKTESGFARSSLGTSRGHLLLHELGHVVGLAHSTEPKDIMVSPVNLYEWPAPTGPQTPDTAERLAAIAQADFSTEEKTTLQGMYPYCRSTTQP